MTDNAFGEYLRELRKTREPQMTQEMLAQAIGRSKMTISQFEKGKNSPPQGELLESLATALSLNDIERSKFYFLAAQSRGSLPSDIEDYFFENPAICDVIRAAMNNSDHVDWCAVAENFGAKNEED
ncbi:helix-turn-helix domain-containing protein [Mogibacterium timidum]|uniref:helix-turn-helix domain-containing protein n=1 Tax=Mogibacterium timidum TaxID=35519 RepID=UPI002352ECE0|nr:helix-turn-helix transcriptional regulator [Mogibacterium timidum]